MKHPISSFIIALAFLAGTLRAVPPKATLPAASSAPSGQAATTPASGSSAAQPSRGWSSPFTMVRPSEVVVEPGPGGQTSIKVSSIHPLHCHSFRMDDPPRLVVDIENASFAAAPKAYPATSSLIRAVRVAGFTEKMGPVVRIVAELEGNPKSEIESGTGGFRIILKSRRDVATADAKLPGRPAQTTSSVLVAPGGASTSAARAKNTSPPATNAASNVRAPEAVAGTKPLKGTPSASPVGPPSSSYDEVGSAEAPLPSSSEPVNTRQRYTRPLRNLLTSAAFADVPATPKASVSSTPPATPSAGASWHPKTPATTTVSDNLTSGTSASTGTKASVARLATPTAAVSKPATSRPAAMKPAASSTRVGAPPLPSTAKADVPVVRPTMKLTSGSAYPAAAAQTLTAASLPVPSFPKTRSLAAKSVDSAPAAASEPAASPEAQRAKDAARTLGSGSALEAGGTLPAGDPSSRGRAQTPDQYTGERISLNLKDVDLKDFFRLIHEVSGLNVVIDPDVSGTVTLVLDDVPWDQALDIVLRNNGLGKELEGNVLRIAKISTLTGEQEAAGKLAEAQANATPLVTVFRQLKYAHAEDRMLGASAGVGLQGSQQQVPMPGIATMLQKLPGVLSKRGSVVQDVRDNAVIITDAVSQIPTIDGVIEKLDKRTKQISIQARIVAANSDFTRTLSSALSGGLTNPSGSTKIGGATGTGVSALPPTPSGTPSSAVAVPTNIRGIAGTASTLVTSAASGFGVFAITNASKNYFINTALAAAESRQQAKTISEPSIVTQDHMPGEVIQGTQIPIQTNVNNTISVQYINASLQLDVTAQVTGDGSVFLTIQVINATPGAILPSSGNPEINTQQVTTQVLVPDGGTVVFGGVKVTSRTRATTQVPGIGNIPIIGDLFKSKNDEDNDQELLFFVTPTVLPG